MVTWSGSPPNALIFLFTHRKASIWSNSPALPGTSSVSNESHPLCICFCINRKKLINMSVAYIAYSLAKRSRSQSIACIYITQRSKTILNNHEHYIMLHKTTWEIFKRLTRSKRTSMNPEHDRKKTSSVRWQLLCKVAKVVVYKTGNHLKVDHN